MSGIIHKIGETLHVGGQKKEEGESHGEHKPGDQFRGEPKLGECHGEHKLGDQFRGEHKGDLKHEGEQKEGFMDKIKDKVHGDGQAEGEKKKKKEKKKHEQGHEHEHGHGSSSDSDSD